MFITGLPPISIALKFKLSFENKYEASKNSATPLSSTNLQTMPATKEVF